MSMLDLLTNEQSDFVSKTTIDTKLPCVISIVYKQEPRFRLANRITVTKVRKKSLHTGFKQKFL